MLKIAVCIKQIPLIEEANFDAVTKTIKRDGPNVISAYDLRAISLAVDLKNRHGAETTVVTMGPPQARDALVDALAMGMDRAVHLEDRAFAGADTLATARALALWLARGNFDLIMLGKYSLDAETGQVGPEIAELIGAAQITGARKLEIDGRTLRAERESDEGFDEVEAEMPAVITCAERVAQPVKVKPGAGDEAKTRPIQSVRAAELGADPKEFGLAGSPTWVQEVRVVATPKTECKFIDAADPERAATEDDRRRWKDLARSSRACTIAARSATARRASKRDRDVWIMCETDLEGRITRGTLELLSRGDELASRLGGALVAVGFDGARRATRGTAGEFRRRPGADDRASGAGFVHSRGGRRGCCETRFDARAVGNFARRDRARARLGTAAGRAARAGAHRRCDRYRARRGESDGRAQAGVRRQHRRADLLENISADGDGAAGRARTRRAIGSQASRNSDCALRGEPAEKPARQGALDPRRHDGAARRRRSRRRYRHGSRRTRRRRESRRVRASAGRRDVRDAPRDRPGMGAAAVAGRA